MTVDMTYDAIVVGGSFAGVSAALQLGRACRRVLLVDAAQPRNRFANSAHGFLGHDGKAPGDIMREAKSQLQNYANVELVDGLATNAQVGQGGFSVTLSNAQTVHGTRLILATGVTDELPPIPGVAERWGQTVLHCPYCHGYEARGGALGVLANHVLSVHQAMLLPDWGPTTYFTQGTFVPTAEEATALAARGVRIESSPIVELLGAAPDLEAVRLEDGRVLPIDSIFTAPKTSMSSPLAEQLGCVFESGPLGPYISVNEQKQTSVAGVYAAGDAATPFANAVMAAAAGAMAGFGVHQSLVFGAPHTG